MYLNIKELYAMNLREYHDISSRDVLLFFLHDLYSLDAVIIERNSFFRIKMNLNLHLERRRRTIYLKKFISSSVFQ